MALSESPQPMRPVMNHCDISQFSIFPAYPETPPHPSQALTRKPHWAYYALESFTKRCGALRNWAEVRIVHTNL